MKLGSWISKEKVAEYAPAATETINSVMDSVKEKAGEFADKAEDFAGDAIASVKEKVESFTENLLNL
jgi:hypothetical protein